MLFAIAWRFLPQVTSGALTIGSFTLLVSMLDQLVFTTANASSQFATSTKQPYASLFRISGLPDLVRKRRKPVPLANLLPRESNQKRVISLPR